MRARALALLRSAAPYVASVGLGFWGAWTVQALHIRTAKQALAQYEQQVDMQLTEEFKRTTQLNEATQRAHLKKISSIHEFYRTHPSSVPAKYTALSASLVPPSPLSLDAGAANACPCPAELTPLIEDCAVTTLQLLDLQNWNSSVSEQ